MAIDPAIQTRQWIDQLVVGLNLCPFASSVLQADTVQMTVCSLKRPHDLLNDVLEQLKLLTNTNEARLSTSFLIFNQALSDFDHYLAFADAANDLLVEVGLESEIQIATFHPDYCFDGVDADDVSHYSNRSPFPMLHFLRESQISKALENYPNPEKIPDDNIRRLRSMGKKAVLALSRENT